MSKYLLKDMVEKVKKPVEFKKEIIKKPIKNKSRYMLWSVAFISVVFFLFSISFLFGQAKVLVNPKIKEVVLNENLSAKKNGNVNDLSFDLVIIGGDESVTVKTLGEKDVNQKATGTVIIYNAFSSSPQPLSIDTRLEGSNGKIYKTQTKTIVPGMSKNGTPGSIEVKIYASVAGAEYNSAPLDFKIFGFKGTSKYSKIYARSKGEITGGLVGKVPNISDADKVSTVNNLKVALQAKLLEQATNQIPNGFILFKNAIFLNTDDIKNEPNITSTYDKDSNMTTLTLSGTFYGILFDEQKLTKKIAQDNIDKYDDSDVFIPNIRDLDFTLSAQAGLTNKDNVSFGDLQNINFNLSGSVKIVWKLDVDKFTTDLLGKSKKDFSQILSQYPNVDSATLTLSPLWKISIPNKAKDVKVIVNYPN